MDQIKNLLAAIEKKIENIPLKILRSHSLKLIKKYRTLRTFNLTFDEKLSYITFRMPATFSAIKHVLNEFKTLEINTSINTILDLGSGPGTALFACLSMFEKLNKMTLVERDKEFFEISKDLSKNIKNLDKISFIQKDILSFKDYDHDLILVSYVLNELKTFQIDRILKRFINSNAKVIIFLEPGTIYGFENIRYLHDKVIKEDLKIIAPCPNNLKCPMAKNDWCHFFVRLDRSKYHKYLKKGTLSYEDEKFSYLIVTKTKSKKYESRVLRNPKKVDSNIELTLCHDGEIKKDIIDSKDIKKYKIYKKIKWGDIL
jgi:ribosomal protein RSM22 (predicted rRNA methylase)